MKRLCSILVLIFVFALILPLYAQNQTAKPKAVIEQPTYDAGEIYRTGAKLEHAFIVKNTGAAELQILSAKPG